ncbi:MAG: histidinol-phosphate aminotransferase family protein [Dehalococcoidales bacterium]|nr:histidinol-phosphate aminotransferase family protein [Dehalococcoidales bacterium]
MLLEPRPEIESLPAVIHGGPDYAELESLGLAADRVLDFSVCCNPYPPPAGVRRSLRKVSIDRYPDSSASGFVRKLAQLLGTSSREILAGSGSTELIRLVALTYLSPGDRVLVLKPTYGEYELACRIAGARIVEHFWNSGKDRSSPVDELIQEINRHYPRIVFICNPNNPTGLYLDRTRIGTVLKACKGSLLVLDEAYVSFAEEQWSSLDLVNQGHVIILRSMTKDYALAGLRLGYLLASEEIVRSLRRVCPPWNVNAAAQQAGLAALDDSGYLERSRQKILRSKRYLISKMSKLGFSTEPSQANFFLVKTGCGRQFRSALLRQGILVRDCASFGLPEHVRIAPRTMAECKRFINAVSTITMKNIEKPA